MTSLYKARADRPFSARLARENGLALEKLKNYRPSEKEPFMNDRQRDYFRAKLLAWKDEILRESRITLQTLQEENVNHPDLADRASSETDRAIELRARDRQRKLISKIDAALQRTEANPPGYGAEAREADLPEAPGGAPDGNPPGGSAGAPRETREGLSRRVGLAAMGGHFVVGKNQAAEAVADDRHPRGRENHRRQPP